MNVIFDRSVEPNVAKLNVARECQWIRVRLGRRPDVDLETDQVCTTSNASNGLSTKISIVGAFKLSFCLQVPIMLPLDEGRVTDHCRSVTFTFNSLGLCRWP